MLAKKTVLTKILVFALVLGALFATRPAAAMMNSKAMFMRYEEKVGRRRAPADTKPCAEEILREIIAVEKAWGEGLERELPTALMPHLGNSNLVDLVGMSASKYYQRKVQEGAAKLGDAGESQD